MGSGGLTLVTSVKLDSLLGKLDSRLALSDSMLEPLLAPIVEVPAVVDAAVWSGLTLRVTRPICLLRLSYAYVCAPENADM